jgi:peptidoglycan/LPS O-acetylase OafA/YrhL
MPLHGSHLTHPKYRSDIDGLRAVAVLSVVGYHAVKNLMPGGFIGVDIFFVISGFLISTILFENLERGTFSFVEFYARRVKRIFPALVIVLLAVYAFGWFALLSEEYMQLGKHMAAGASFVSNLVLWSEARYFDNLSETKPLLHLWSLGVEEQFYVVWPLILWFVWLLWKRPAALLFTVIVIASFSFLLNLNATSNNVVAAFYSAQTRFWELLSGSLLAWLSLYRPNTRFELYRLTKLRIFPASHPRAEQIRKIAVNLTSIIGVGLIFLGLTYIHAYFSFPGAWAVFPVLGAALLIFAGPQAWFNQVVLSNPIAKWFGLISFPLYLWHWPLLSFARIVESDNSQQEVAPGSRRTRYYSCMVDLSPHRTADPTRPKQRRENWSPFELYGRNRRCGIPHLPR